MLHDNDGEQISHPRLLSAIYFCLLAVIATIVIDCVVYALGVSQFVPLSQALLWAVVVSAGFGALFGKKIIQSTFPYRKKAFLGAFLMVLSALPVYDAGFVLLFYIDNPLMFGDDFFFQLTSFYLFVLWFSLILAGIWLAIAAGFAALFLRGFLAYHLMHSLSRKRQLGIEKKI